MPGDHYYHLRWGVGGVKVRVSPPGEPAATVVDPGTLCTVATLTRESGAHHQCGPLWPPWARIETIARDVVVCAYDSIIQPSPRSEQPEMSDCEPCTVFLQSKG